jgi:putative ABC transport system permease protein
MQRLNAKLAGLIRKHNPEDKENKLILSQFSRGHLYGEFKNGVSVGGQIAYVRLFLVLAIGILLIACINFMNLSTARSENRAREVGVRKVVGASRFSLVWQFMGRITFDVVHLFCGGATGYARIYRFLQRDDA